MTTNAGADSEAHNQYERTRTVDVFFCNMAMLEDSQLDPRVLSQDELERAELFRFERDRRMFTFCRAALRELLAQRTGAPAASLRFELGPRGKPCLPDQAVSFNISHAGDWFACAVAASGDIGVDIEHVRPMEEMHDMANQFFAPGEASRLEAIPESARTSSFFECWTRKEAVIKATGEGVSRPLDSFEVDFGPGTRPALLRLDDQLNPGWHMSSFLPAPGYVAALASPGAFGEVRITFLDGRNWG